MSRSRAARPFLVLPPEAIRPSPVGWAVVVDGETIAMVSDGSPLSNWDSLLSFQLERDFHFNIDPIQQLGLQGTQACLQFVVTCTTGGGAHRDVLFRATFGSGSDRVVRAVVCPSSEQVARELVIRSGVYLATDIDGGTQLAPKLAGARLWEMGERIRIEGGAARLPLYAVPFSVVFAGQDMEKAEFHVEIAADLDIGIESSLTTYVNTERADFVAQIAQRGSPAERRLWNGIVRRVLLQLIISGELEREGGNAVSDPSSLIATGLRWAGFVWPYVDPKRLRSHLMDNLATCEAQIDSWLNAQDDVRRSGRIS